MCQRNAQLHSSPEAANAVDWESTAQAYPNLEEAPSFISRQHDAATRQSFTTAADPANLQGKQLEAYSIVRDHMNSDSPPPLRIIISGTAWTGKSYMIHCLRLLLQHRVRVAAPTGVAAFNIEGQTLHGLLKLPTKGDFKDLEGERLQNMQQSLADMNYLIIDEMSMVGRKTFGQVDRRLRQVFPHQADNVFGGCSCLLFGDFGQLPPVMDLPLYTTDPRSALSDLGNSAYQLFNKAIVLNQVMHQSGQEHSQVLFRTILHRMRNGSITEDDWRELMKHTRSQLADDTQFTSALHLRPTVEAVVEHNVANLHASGQPIATINAVHTGPNASKASPDDAAGLEPVISIAHGARVMLTANLWVDAGLVNGAMGTVVAICYKTGQSPPHLPVAVMVQFDSYSGPTLHDGTVPICPIRSTWSTSGAQCSRQQLPLKLAWAVTIHKAQGMTLDKVVIDVGKKEFSCGLTFVACSCVRKLSDLLLDPPFKFQRLATLGNSRRLRQRLDEDTRLLHMDTASSLLYTSPSVCTINCPSPALQYLDTPSLPLMDTQSFTMHFMNHTPTSLDIRIPSPSLNYPLSPPMDFPTPSPPASLSPTPPMDFPTPSPPPSLSPPPPMHFPTLSPPVSLSYSSSHGLPNSLPTSVSLLLLIPLTSQLPPHQHLSLSSSH